MDLSRLPTSGDHWAFQPVQEEICGRAEEEGRPAMLKSMTGFGRAEGETPLGRISVESRSINHRYCDINIRLPKHLAPFETRIKEVVRSEVSRGRSMSQSDWTMQERARFNSALTLILPNSISRLFRP